MKRWARLTCCLCLGLASCGSSSKHPPELADPVGAGSTTTSIDVTAFVQAVGYVVAQSTLLDGIAYSASYARFVRAGEPDACVVTLLETGCVHRRCPDLHVHDTLLSAGAIRLETPNGAAVVLRAVAGNDYAVQDMERSWWRGGEVVRVTADGGDVQPFSVNLRAPPASESAANDIFPLVDHAGNIYAERHDWRGARVEARLRAPHATELGSVECYFNTPEGAFVFPSRVSSAIFDTVAPEATQLDVSIVSQDVVSTNIGVIAVQLSGPDDTFVLHPRETEGGI